MGKIPTDALKYSAIPALLVVAGVCVFFASGHLFKTEKADSAPFLSANDLPAGSALHATLEHAGRVSEFAATNGVIDKAESAISSPYRLSTSVKLPKDRYRDFQFTVTRDSLSVVTDGFHAGDLVFLDINGRNVYGRIPSDWSGKIELTTALPQDRTINTCVKVAGKTESFSLCHSLPERQVM